MADSKQPRHESESDDDDDVIIVKAADADETNEEEEEEDVRLGPPPPPPTSKSEEAHRIRKNGDLLMYIVKTEQSLRALDEYEENARSSLNMHLQLIDHFRLKETENKVRLKEVQHKIDKAEKRVAVLNKRVTNVENSYSQNKNGHRKYFKMRR